MIRWVTENLGTAAWDCVQASADFCLIDVRDLVDKAGNQSHVIRTKIDLAAEYLRAGSKVVICCDYGISRSNAIAAGVLAVAEGIPLGQAVRRIMAVTGQEAIRVEVLAAVRKALELQEAVGSVPQISRPRILVTGASGFVGSSLILDLEITHDVIKPTRQELDLSRETIALDLLVKDRGVTTLLHLASPRIYTTNESLGTALVMLKNVLDVCIENGLFLIYLSGWEVYSGYRAQELRADESLCPRPGGSYGQAKMLCEALIRHYSEQYGLRHLILRSGPVYGPGSDRPRFIFNFIEKALYNAEIATHKYKNGFPTLDLLHIDDLRAAVLTAIEKRVEGAINIGGGIGTSTRAVAEMIVELVGSSSKIRHVEIDEFASNIVMNLTRAHALLGWRPAIGIREGLEGLIRRVGSQRSQ